MDQYYQPDPEELEAMLQQFEQENQDLEDYLTVTWRAIPHNHKDDYHHDTCALCVMEQALYGGLR